MLPSFLTLFTSRGPANTQALLPAPFRMAAVKIKKTSPKEGKRIHQSEGFTSPSKSSAARISA